jgi:hypothetical protein
MILDLSIKYLSLRSISKSLYAVLVFKYTAIGSPS